MNRSIYTKALLHIFASFIFASMWCLDAVADDTGLTREREGLREKLLFIPADAGWRWYDWSWNGGIYTTDISPDGELTFDVGVWNYGGGSLNKYGRRVDTASYNYLSFKVMGITPASQNDAYNIAVILGDPAVAPQATIGDYLVGGIETDVWKEVMIPLSDLGMQPGMAFMWLTFHEKSDDFQEVKVSDIRLLDVRASCQGAIDFPDTSLKEGIREAYSLPPGDIYYTDVYRRDVLYFTDRIVSDLTGLECFTNLEMLSLPGSNISDISPVAELHNLSQIALPGANVSDVSPVCALSRLAILALTDNNVSDLSPLDSNCQIDKDTILDFRYNPIDCDNAVISSLASEYMNLLIDCDD